MSKSISTLHDFVTTAWSLIRINDLSFQVKSFSFMATL